MWGSYDCGATHAMQLITSGAYTLYFCTCHLFFPSRPPAAEPESRLTCYFWCGLSAKTRVHHTHRDFIISHSTQGCPLALFPLCFCPWFLQKVWLPFPHFKVPALIQSHFHPTTPLIFTVLIVFLVFFSFTFQCKTYPTLSPNMPLLRYSMQKNHAVPQEDGLLYIIIYIHLYILI